MLERVAEKGVGHVSHGKLIVRSGTTIHQVVVKRFTPGAVEPGNALEDTRAGFTMEVSFDPGRPLRFSPEKPGGVFTLVDPVKRGPLADLFASFGAKRRLKVDFAGARWPVVAGADARLLIERDALGRLRRTHRVLPGVRVPPE